MMGLMVLVVLAVYLLISVWVTKKAASWAKANNKKPWLWGGLAAFVMYNLVFWDLIPTLVMHKYYCDTQAGFSVYKTPEQWLRENPELTKEELKAYEDGDEKKHVVLYSGTPQASAITNINSRIYQTLDVEKINGISIFPLGKRVEYIADSASERRLAELITFTSGYGGRTWQGFLKNGLFDTSCGGTNEIKASRLEWENFIYEFTGLGEQK